jgi:hypothetical protein
VRLLLKHGADPTIANNDGSTLVATAQLATSFQWVSTDRARECVAALKVRAPFCHRRYPG